MLNSSHQGIFALLLVAVVALFDVGKKQTVDVRVSDFFPIIRYHVNANPRNSSVILDEVLQSRVVRVARSDSGFERERGIFQVLSRRERARRFAVPRGWLE